MTIQQYIALGETATAEDVKAALADNALENNWQLSVKMLETYLDIELPEEVNSDTYEMLSKIVVGLNAIYTPKVVAYNNLLEYEAIGQLQKIGQEKLLEDRLKELTGLPKVVSNLPETTGLLTPEFIEEIINSKEKFITIEASTSSGKTYSATNIAENYNALFITPLNAIKSQTSFGIEYNVKTLLAAIEDGEDLRGTVSAEALNIALSVMEQDIEKVLFNTTLFVDELHMYTTEATYRPAMGQVLSKILTAYSGQVIGLTATPTEFEKAFSHVIKAESRLTLNRTFKSYMVPKKPKGGLVGFRKATIASIVKEIKETIPKEDFTLIYSENSLDFNEALVDKDTVQVNAPLRDEMTKELIAVAKEYHNDETPAEVYTEKRQEVEDKYPFYELLHGNQTIKSNSLLFSPMGLAGVNVQNEVETAHIIILAKNDYATTNITINQIIGRVRKAKNVNVHIIYDEASKFPRRNKRLSEAYMKDLNLDSAKALTSFAISERTIANNNSLLLLKASQLAYLDDTAKQTIDMTKNYIRYVWHCEVEEIERELSEEELKATYKSTVDEMVKVAKDSEELYDLLMVNDRTKLEEEYDYDLVEEMNVNELNLLTTVLGDAEINKIEGVYTIKKLRNLWREHTDIFINEELRVYNDLKDGEVRTLRTRKQISKEDDEVMVERLNTLPTEPLRIDKPNANYFKKVSKIIPSPFIEYINVARGKTKYELLNQFIDGKVKRNVEDKKYYFTPNKAFTYADLLGSWTKVEETDREDDKLMDSIETGVEQIPKGRLVDENFTVSVSGVDHTGLSKLERTYQSHQLSGFITTPFAHPDFKETVGLNVTLCPWEFKDHYKKNVNLLTDESNLIIVDIDGYSNIHTVHNTLDEMNIAHYITTGSKREREDKYHIFLPLDRKVNGKEYKKVMIEFGRILSLDMDDTFSSYQAIFQYDGSLVLGDGVGHALAVDDMIEEEVVVSKLIPPEVKKEMKKINRVVKREYKTYNNEGERPLTTMNAHEKEMLTFLQSDEAGHNDLFRTISSFLMRGFNHTELFEMFSNDLNFDDIWVNKVETIFNQQSTTF